jgi:dihydrofolate reductase
MNEKAKFVFSKTIQNADWNNTKLLKSDVEGHVRKLKQEPGKDLIICGSATLGATLMEHNLIDEYRIMVNPIVLGQGHSLFKAFKGKLNLNHVGTREFRSGNVLLTYQTK